MPALSPQTLLMTRPTLRVRAQMVRHRRIADCLRKIERILEVNKYIATAQSRQDRDRSLMQYEARLAKLVCDMELESTRLMLEASTLYTRER